MDATVTITVLEYEQLLDDVRLLDALRAAGVDNWQGMDEALDLYWEAHSNQNEGDDG